MVPGFGVSAECQSIGTIGKKQRVVTRSTRLVLPVWKCIMFNGSYLRARMKFWMQKIKFSLLESGRTKPWCPSLVSQPSAKAQEPLARSIVSRSRWLVIQPPKLSVGAYFELSFLVCGFLIHLSNRYDSPQFRAPWKKIRQKYGTQQEPFLFKRHPFSCQYGDALCSMVPS